MTAHAHLGPSAAKRWMTCPGSTRLLRDIPDQGGEAAAMGTYCHEQLARRLRKQPTVEPGPGDVYCDGFSFPYTEEMAGWVNAAASWVEKYLRDHPGSQLFTERLSPVGAAFGCPDELWGTADIVILNPEEHELVVADAKFGFEEVDVESNEQVSLYAIGVVHSYGWHRFDAVELVILQPRSPEPVKVEVITIGELRDRKERYEPLVARALDPDAPLVPADDACRWCRAAGQCPAVAGRARRLAQAEFQKPELLTPEAMAEVLAEAKLIAKALKAIEARALQLAQLGTTIPGWKVVRSNKHRAWKDPKSAAEALELAGLDPWLPKALMSPAQAEKALALPPKTLDALAPKPEGEPTLAPESDPREPLAPEFTPE